MNEKVKFCPLTDDGKCNSDCMFFKTENNSVDLDKIDCNLANALRSIRVLEKDVSLIKSNISNLED